ncbi:MAG: uracil-DNA glycosylase [Anaerolineae bacterium]
MAINGNKGKQLEEIAKEVRDLKESPLYEYRKEQGYSPVIGEGDAETSIMLIGEAPGAQEAKTGRPFAGNAGQILDQLLESIDMVREKVYITNVVKDRPPGNRDPHVGEIELYGPFLLQQIEIIQPRVIATLGRFATEFILEHFDHHQQDQSIGDLHGKKLETETLYGEVVIMPLYHPAAAFYNPDLKKRMQEDFHELEQLV